jgi:hypothetical protein
MFSLKKLSPTITDMIRFDHSHTLVTFHQYTATAKPKVKKALADNHRQRAGNPCDAGGRDFLPGDARYRQQ